MQAKNDRIDFDKDTTSDEDAFWYRALWLLGSIQELIAEHCVQDPVWRSFDGRVTSMRKMSDKHLYNSIRYCARNLETDSVQYRNLVRERTRREQAAAHY